MGLVVSRAQSQTIYTWTSQAGGNIATATNWDPNGLPNGATQDTTQFDGRTTGPLTVTANSVSLPGTGFGGLGINFIFTPNQVSSVTFTSSVPGFAMANVGIYNISNNSSSSAITFGNPGTIDYGFNFVARPAGAVHAFVNNSSQPATIHGNVRWQAGGGASYTLAFGGTGDWTVNNYLVTDSAGVFIQKDGAGTVTWTPGGYLPNAGLASPITINQGKLILAAAHPRLGAQAITNNATFVFAAATAQVQALSGVISGPGRLVVSNGTLTLSGASTYTGNTILNGGSLVVNRLESATNGPLGVSGTIFFNGGTLGFSASNHFDYSPRFSLAAGQAYNIDTGGQNVMFTNALVSNGGTLNKAGMGTLTLAGVSSYGGATTISAGKLVFQGSKLGAGNITVADNAALGVTTTGMSITSDTLTLGTGSGAVLEFNEIDSTITAPLVAGTLLTGGTLTILINSGKLSAGQSYPLLVWTNGAVPTVSLGAQTAFAGSLSFVGKALWLNVAAVSAPTLNFTRVGNSLQLFWNTNFGGYKLQAQTNDNAVGLSTNWSDYPSGNNSPVSMPMGLPNEAIFFRLVSL